LVKRPSRTRQPDEVLIDVHAASVSYMDYLMISGGYQMRLYVIGDFGFSC
jgi:NADPH:quinone reductase-like Zn-dependent oxidoreductase